MSKTILKCGGCDYIFERTYNYSSHSCPEYKPIKVVVDYKGKLYRNIITKYKKLSDNYTTILPKYRNCQYYSEDYMRRMTQDTVNWKDLEMLIEEEY